MSTPPESTSQPTDRTLEYNFDGLIGPRRCLVGSGNAQTGLSQVVQEGLFVQFAALCENLQQRVMPGRGLARAFGHVTVEFG